MADLIISVADQVFKKTASTGIYNFSMGLVDALAGVPATNLTVFANPAQQFGSRIHEKSVQRFDGPARSIVERIIWDQWGVYRAAKKTACDWLLLPKGFSSFLTACPVKLAVYIHDIIPLVYAERYPASISRKKYLYLKQSYRGTLQSAEVVFTNTEYTRGEIERWARENKIRCPPVCVAGYGFSPPKPDLSVEKKDTIAVLIRPDPHKRPDLCLKYMERWQAESGWTGGIVFIGCDAVQLRATPHSGWKWAGRISSSRCLQLMREARAVVHFTEYEGFGMPPVEAVMAGSCPVFSAIPVALEVMGDCGAGFENSSYESFCRAMYQALASGNEQIAGWQQWLSRRHSWDRVARCITSTLQ